MKTTSYFVGIEIPAYFFSDIFVAVYQYTQSQNIEHAFSFQNPLSTHITLYYFENNLTENTQNEIKNFSKKFHTNDAIFFDGYDYFFRDKKRFILYLKTKTALPLARIRDEFHSHFSRNSIPDNNFHFSPHITFLKILDAEIFEKHRENIETIIQNEIEKIQNFDINSGKIFLYAVNSHFQDEIQIKIF